MATAGPAVRVDGTPETVSHEAPVVTELMSIVPPPEFCSPRVCEDETGFELYEVKESRLELSVSSGGGAVTVSATEIFCVSPPQAEEGTQLIEMFVE